MEWLTYEQLTAVIPVRNTVRNLTSVTFQHTNQSWVAATVIHSATTTAQYHNYNLYVTESTVIFKELLFMTVSVSECPIKDFRELT